MNATGGGVIPLCADDVCGHVLADWVPSLPAAVGSSFVGWPKFLLQQFPMNGRDFLTLRAEVGRSERQWKGVLSWMLGVAGARHVLAYEGYRWVAPLSAFYPNAKQTVDLSAWNSTFPRSSISAWRVPGSRTRLLPDYLALRSTSSASPGYYEWAVAEAKGTRVSLTSASTCPSSWSKQVRNAVISVNGTRLRVPRHLVIATRVNPNATSTRARRIQLRAWNNSESPKEPTLGVDGAIEIVAANLFGLFKGLGLRQNALAIALSVQRRSPTQGGLLFKDVEVDSARVFHGADRELERIKRPAAQTDEPATGVMWIETELGPIQVGIAEPLLALARHLRNPQSSQENETFLRKTDAQLDSWQKSRDVAAEPERPVVLPFGVEIRIPTEFEGG